MLYKLQYFLLGKQYSPGYFIYHHRLEQQNVNESISVISQIMNLTLLKY